MPAPLPSYDTSIQFLLRFHKTRPWVLTAIQPDTRDITTCTFDATETERCKAWLMKIGQTHNLYFSVGGVNGVLSKKATRDQITEVCYLHVDIDCRAGEPLGTERRRISQLLQDPKHVPPPTLIVDSGGGFWGFWQLNVPLPGDGTIETADERGRYNRQLELLLGGDNCFDVSRIARLPGSINWPDQKKRDKGRTPEKAVIVEWHEDRVYSIEQFNKSDPLKPLTSVMSSNLDTESVKRLETVDELGDNVSAYVKMLIVQGHDPDDPNKFPSRSEAVWFVTCALIESGVADQVIYSVLTDPEFSISESVLEQTSHSRDYAARQIGRAKVFVLSKDKEAAKVVKDANAESAALFVGPSAAQGVPGTSGDAAGPQEAAPGAPLPSSPEEWIDWMNRKHAVIGNMGGKCRVIEELYHDQLKRTFVSFQAVYDFQQRYQHVKVTMPSPTGRGRKVTLPLGAYWIDNERRRYYDRVEFIPRDNTPPNIYNLWRGFGVPDVEGECNLLLKHLYENICGGVEEYYEYLLNWMARAVQFPWRPGYTAVVLRGAMGAGKGVAINAFGRLFGRHYLSIRDTRHLVGNFNEHLQDCCVLFADEAFYAGDTRNESSLKALITEPTLAIEGKGLKTVTSPNFLHILMASNSDWVVPASVEDRRFFILDVLPGKKNNTSYFRPMMEQLEQGGYSGLLYMLKRRDIAKFDVTLIPQTRALGQQKLLSLGIIAQWWYDKLQEGKVLVHHGDWKQEISCEQLKQDLFSFCRTMGRHIKPSSQGVNKTLAEVLGTLPKKCKVTGEIEIATDTGTKRIERPYMWILPTLEECRAAWDQYIGQETEWASLGGEPTYEQYVLPSETGVST